MTYRDPPTPFGIRWIPQKDAKLKVLYVSDDVWCAALYVLFAATPESYAAWMKQTFNREDKEFSHCYFTTEVIVGTGATKDVVVLSCEWEWTIDQYAILVHELHHVTTNMLMRKGLKHTRDTEEVWAYSQDAMLQKVLHALKFEKQTHRMAAFVDRLNKEADKPKKRRLAKKRGSK